MFYHDSFHVSLTFPVLNFYLIPIIKENLQVLQMNRRIELNNSCFRVVHVAKNPEFYMLENVYKKHGKLYKDDVTAFLPEAVEQKNNRFFSIKEKSGKILITLGFPVDKKWISPALKKLIRTRKPLLRKLQKERSETGGISEATKGQLLLAIIECS